MRQFIREGDCGTEHNREAGVAMKIQASSVAAAMSVTLVTLLFTGCAQPQPNAPKPSTGPAAASVPLPPSSGKGYELYAWQEGPNWRYALLEGTNATKEDSNIVAARSRLQSLDDVIRALGSIRPKEYVSLRPRRKGEPIPPRGDLAKLRSYCESRQLHLQGPGITF